MRGEVPTTDAGMAFEVPADVLQGVAADRIVRDQRTERRDLLVDRRGGQPRVGVDTRASPTQEGPDLVGTGGSLIAQLPSWLVKAISAALFAFGAQITTANLAATHEALSTALGAAAALMTVSALALLAGLVIADRVPLRTVRRIGGMCMLGLAVWSTIEVFTTASRS